MDHHKPILISGDGVTLLQRRRGLNFLEHYTPLMNLLYAHQDFGFKPRIIKIIVRGTQRRGDYIFLLIPNFRVGGT